MRRAAREIGRAVDRIDHPGRAALACRPRLALLADEPVGGKHVEKPRGDEGLGLLIDFGQEVMRAFETDREGMIVEAAPGDFARLARDRLSGEQPHFHERRSAFGHLYPCQKWLKAPRAKTTASPSGPMKTGGRRPATASPTQVKGTPAAAAAASKAARRCAWRGGEKLIVVAAGRRNLEQVRVGAPIAARAAGDSGRRSISTRALTPETSQHLREVADETVGHVHAAARMRSHGARSSQAGAPAVR